MGNANRLFSITFACFAAGVGSVIIFSLFLTMLVGGEKADQIIFGVSPAIPAFIFGALWFPYIRKHMK